MISIKKLDAAHCVVECGDRGVAREVNEHFGFEVPNARYHPLVKARKWDGRVSLYNLNDRLFPNGLIPHLEQFGKERGYPVATDFGDLNDLDYDDVCDFVSSLKISNGKGQELFPHEYQMSAINDALCQKRILLSSPTSSGKSLVLYALMRYLEKEVEGKILVLVPNVSLINQIVSDFKEYSELNKWNCDTKIHKISAGESKNSKKKIYASTWQSIYKQEAEYFEQFDAVLVDECFHGDTLVKTPDGHKKISEMKPGDLVINLDAHGNQKEDIVVKVHRNLSKSEGEKFYEICFDNGAKIKVTGNHMLMLTDGTWKRADEITEEDDVLCVQ